MKGVLLILTGYLLGSMPWGYWLPRILRGVNIRKVGSGSTGAANVWRTLGFKIGLGVALLDLVKGLAAALLGVWLGNELIGLLAGIAALIGHWRPLFIGFGRGGKIVATTGGVTLALAPFATLAVAGVWIATFLVTRYTSVASLLSGATARRSESSSNAGTSPRTVSRPLASASLTITPSPAAWASASIGPTERSSRFQVA